MIVIWSSLREDLVLGVQPLWTHSHKLIAEQLSGRIPEGIGYSRIDALSRAMHCDFRNLPREESDLLTLENCQRWGGARMLEIVDTRLAELREHRATLDLASIAIDRAEAGERALFDASKEAVLARKYEGAAERGLYRALKEFREVEKAAPEAPEPSSADQSGGKLASFFQSTDEADSIQEPPILSPSRPVAEPTSSPSRTLETTQNSIAEARPGPG